MVYLIGRNDSASLAHVSALSSSAGKFVVMRNGDIVFAAYEDLDYHYKIGNQHQDLCGSDVEVRNGGHWQVVDGMVWLHGSSGDFGPFDRKEIAARITEIQSTFQTEQVVIH